MHTCLLILSRRLLPLLGKQTELFPWAHPDLFQWKLIVLSNISYPAPWVTLMKGQGIHRPAVQTSCLGRVVCWQEGCWGLALVCRLFSRCSYISDVVKIVCVRKLCRSVTHNIHISVTSWITQNKPVLFDLLLVCASMRGETWCECVCETDTYFRKMYLVKVREWCKCFHYLENTLFTSLKKAASTNTCLRRTAFDTWAALNGEGRTPPAGVAAVASLQCWISRCWTVVRHPSSWYSLCQN